MCGQTDRASTVNLCDDLYICLCYVVPKGSSPQATIESPTVERLLQCIVEIESKK